DRNIKMTNRGQSATRRMTMTKAGAVTLCTLLGLTTTCSIMAIDPLHVAVGRQPALGELVVEDIFGRKLNGHGLVLVDWEGYLPNPAIKFFVTLPPDTALPAMVVLRATEPRLYFDLPSTAGPDGPRKEIRFEKRDRAAVYLSIFPDRDGKDEDHILEL